MDFACSPTTFLLVTLLAWALLAVLAVVGSDSSQALNELGER